MSVSTFTVVKSIVLPLSASSGDTIVPVYESSPASISNLLPNGSTIISFNSFIKNLKVFASVQSLEESELPDIKLEDSDTDKLRKTLDIEWGSPRKQLNLYIATDSSWYQVGSVSLLNPYGYPFRIYNILDLFTDNLAFELGENGKVGISVQDVGYGLLTNVDKVTVHGSLIEEVVLSEEEVPDNVIINVPPGITNVYVSGIISGSTGSQTDSSMGDNNLIDDTYLVGD